MAKAELHLIRDVLDDQLLDRKGRKMGKVDGIIIELHGDKPPRLAYIEVGGPTVFKRLHPKIGEWAAAIAGKLGKGGEIYRLAWSKVQHQEIDVKADVDIEDTPVMASEEWLSKHIIGRIPGGG
jgi:hypothetical protein